MLFELLHDLMVELHDVGVRSSRWEVVNLRVILTAIIVVNIVIFTALELVRRCATRGLGVTRGCTPSFNCESRRHSFVHRALDDVLGRGVEQLLHLLREQDFLRGRLGHDSVEWLGGCKCSCVSRNGALLGLCDGR